MDAFSFPTFLVVIASEVLILSAVIAYVRRHDVEALALAAFCAALGLYVWFHFGLTSLPPQTKLLLQPLMTCETLPGALLLLFVSGSLFGSMTRVAYGAMALPFFEFSLRYAALFLPGAITEIPSNALVVSGQVSIFLFSGYALWLLYKHKKAYVMETSENRLTAIYLFISPAMLIFLINLIWIALQALGGDVAIIGSRVLFTLLLCLACIWQVVFLVRPPMAFYRIEQPQSSVVREPTADPSPVASNTVTSRAKSDAAWRTLREAIETKELFLDAELSLVQLAREMATNRASLSNLINQHGNMNFNRFINGFRVERAKRLLVTTHDPILEIAFDCGFNAKSTFNRVFKEITGQTPKEFRATSTSSSRSE